MDVKESLAVLVTADRTRFRFARVVLVDRRGRIRRSDDARSGVIQFVARLDPADEVLAALRQVVVDRARIADTDSFPEHRERERTVGVREFPSVESAEANSFGAGTEA